MRFYNRIEELKHLSNINSRSKKRAQMTLMVGRRRIGKTRLILKSVNKESFLYFFVAKKSEKLLCQEFVTEVVEKLGLKIFGEITNFKELFELLLVASKTKQFTLVIDEFQEFYAINPSIYSEMQNIWDRHNNESKINLILSGSVYSLMIKIFENSKEPLFGRTTEKIFLKAFKIDTLKEIMSDYHPTYTPKDLLAFYILTGGVAKYTELFADKNAMNYHSMLNEVFVSNSYFLTEGKNILIEEFGKEYATYFSILSLIASAKTSRQAIESVLEKNIGGYLSRLENNYSIIKKVKPIFAKPGSRNQKYFIEDNFLNFWFRFIFKYQSTVEIENFEYLKDIVHRDFDTYSGRFLEKYFTDKLILTKKYSQIGTYWEKGNKNELDIVAINKVEKRMLIAEVKLNAKNINLKTLTYKATKLVSKFDDYTIVYKGFSLKDM